MKNKSASARVLPILGFKTVYDIKEMTLREILKARFNLDVYNMSPKTKRLIGRDVIGVDPDDLTGDYLLVRISGELIAMPRDECEKAARRKGLRLVGTDEPPEIELLGSIIISRTCYRLTDCPQCQLCEDKVAS
jgi:hypothetical protein